MESILCQSYKNYEVLLIDDGSTDGSGVECGKYAEESPKVKVIHKKNGGVSSARNTGIEKSEGKYIIFWTAMIIGAIYMRWRKSMKRL